MEVFYITPQLMGGAFPSESKSIKKLLEVWERVLVVNLAQEMESYDVKGVSVEDWPVVDGKNMAFGDLVGVTTHIDAFIESKCTFGVFVHCKHGKGRTGSVLVAYLMFKYNVDVYSANALLARRHRIYNNGVTTKCQLKYLHYYQEYLHGSLEYKPDTKWGIDSIKIDNGGSWRFQIEIANVDKCKTQRGLKWTPMGVISNGIEYQTKLITDADICIEIRVKLLLWVSYSTFSVNLSFEKSPLVIKFNDMDGYRGTDHRGKQTFDSITVEYHQI